jgi:hypothetical protein
MRLAPEDEVHHPPIQGANLNLANQRLYDQLSAEVQRRGATAPAEVQTVPVADRRKTHSEE